jgi:hypothetical protein
LFFFSADTSEVEKQWKLKFADWTAHFDNFILTQWPKEKVQRKKQRSTKHTDKTKDRVTRTPLKPEVNSGAPER